MASRSLFETQEIRKLSLQIAVDRAELYDLVMSNDMSLQRTKLCFQIAYNQIIRCCLINGNYDEMPASMKFYYKQQQNSMLCQKNKPPKNK